MYKLVNVRTFASKTSLRLICVATDVQTLKYVLSTPEFRTWFN